jgi:hypothetical protein
LKKKTKIDLGDSEKFHELLGRCIAIWVIVELNLLAVLKSCMDGADADVLSSVFYAIENFRSKAGTVDSALFVALNDKSLRDKWSGSGGLFQRLNAKSAIRNKLAHHMVNHIAVGKSMKVYIHPNIANPRNREGFKATRPTGGYFVTDLENIHGEFAKLADDLRMFAIEIRDPVREHLNILAEEREKAIARALSQVRSADE